MEHSPKNIILFTGLSASGKSTLAQKLSKKIPVTVISLRHDVLHPLAVENGYSRARYWILAATEILPLLALERNKLAQEIKKISKKESPENIIIDDLIDPGTPKFLQKFFNKSKVSVVFIKSNRHLRRKWIIKKMNGSEEEGIQEQRELDGVKIKCGIFKAIKEADFIIKNTGRIESAIRDLRILVEKLN